MVCTDGVFDDHLVAIDRPGIEISPDVLALQALIVLDRIGDLAVAVDAARGARSAWRFRFAQTSVT
jgi:hypothetical protein